MAKIVYKSPSRQAGPQDGRRAASARSASRPLTVAGRLCGRWTPIVRTLDDDLLYVFRRNVAKARRENKRLLGVADFVPPKR